MRGSSVSWPGCVRRRARSSRRSRDRSGGDEEVSAQVARLSVKVDELVAATPTDRLEERIASLDQGQRREEDVLGRVVAEMAALREDARALHGKSETDVAREVAAQVERFSAMISEPGAPPDEHLTGQLERLAARFDELVAAVPWDQIRSLGEGQRRDEGLSAVLSRSSPRCARRLTPSSMRSRVPKPRGRSVGGSVRSARRLARGCGRGARGTRGRSRRRARGTGRAVVGQDRGAFSRHSGRSAGGSD